MTTIAARSVLALVLFAAGALFRAEAVMTRRVADAYARFATLDYTEDGIDEASAGLAGLPPLISSLQADLSRHRATVGYWRSRHDAAAPIAPPARSADAHEAGAAPDPDLLFVAANAAFRSSERQGVDRTTLVSRLDVVLQAYAEVLRATPGHADAAYNYEYVAKLRDTIARERGPIRPRLPPPEASTSIDLPPGPTVHGRPGGPPPDIPGDQFRTLTPMRFDERDETDPGRGQAPRRRG